MTAISRRRLLGGAGLSAFALLLGPEFLAACTRPNAPSGVVGTLEPRPELLFFDDHQASVVEEATARLIPGPLDDPAEAGHPGAREANVTRYLDTLLGALTASPAKVFAGGPFSNRHGWPTDDMAHFLGLTPPELAAWTERITTFQEQYRQGIADLDHHAAGDFASAEVAAKDLVLAKDPGGFTTLLFSHAIDGMYSPPEYGGNAGLVGWTEISFPGDVQPRGFTDAEVSDSDGPDLYRPFGIGKRLLALIDAGAT